MSNYLAEQYFIEASELTGDGKYAEAKKKLEDLLEMEPGYGRAHFSLGWLYFYVFQDFEAANTHYRLAIQYAPAFPTTYYYYAYLLNEINHPVAMKIHAAKALAVRGVDASIIYAELAKSFELNGNYAEATSQYLNAQKYSLCNDRIEEIQKSLERIRAKAKTSATEPFVYVTKA